MDETTVLKLHGVKGVGVKVLIDKKYEKKINKHKWYLSGCGYVMTSGSRKYLHHYIMRIAYKMVVLNGQIDHKDQDKLNNTLKNLRICSVNENNNNINKRKQHVTSRYKGVHLIKQTGRWRARTALTKNGNKKYISLGVYSTEEEAAIAYNSWQQKRTDIREEFKVYNAIN